MLAGCIGVIFYFFFLQSVVHGRAFAERARFCFSMFQQAVAPYFIFMRLRSRLAATRRGRGHSLIFFPSPPPELLPRRNRPAQGHIASDYRDKAKCLYICSPRWNLPAGLRDWKSQLLLVACHSPHPHAPLLFRAPLLAE